MERLIGRTLTNPNEEIFDQGLAFDLETLMIDRRQAMKLLGKAGLAAGLFTIVGCAPGAILSSSSPSSSALGSSAASTTDTSSCDVIPEETAGPYPGDGSNGPDILTQNGVVRSDIRSSFGTSSVGVGRRIASTSSVMAMAKTPSAKVSSRPVSVTDGRVSGVGQGSQRLRRAAPPISAGGRCPARRGNSGGRARRPSSPRSGQARR